MSAIQQHQEEKAGKAAKAADTEEKVTPHG
jgi:hypothetical protein